MSRRYSATFDNIAVTAAQDLFEIATPATTGCTLLGLFVGQTSRQGDTQAEMLRWLILRGATTTGSGGATITAASGLSPGVGVWSSTVKRNNTTAATGGTPQTLHADCFNVQQGIAFWWTPETAPEIAPSSRVVVNIPETPSASMTMSGTLYFEEA
jgi:hypothetical protein